MFQELPKNRGGCRLPTCLGSAARVFACASRLLCRRRLLRSGEAGRTVHISQLDARRMRQLLATHPFIEMSGSQAADGVGDALTRDHWGLIFDILFGILQWHERVNRCLKIWEVWHRRWLSTTRSSSSRLSFIQGLADLDESLVKMGPG